MSDMKLVAWVKGDNEYHERGEASDAEVIARLRQIEGVEEVEVEVREYQQILEDIEAVRRVEGSEPIQGHDHASVMRLADFAEQQLEAASERLLRAIETPTEPTDGQTDEMAELPRVEKRWLCDRGRRLFIGKWCDHHEPRDCGWVLVVRIDGETVPCVHCDDTGWVEDEGWSPEFVGETRVKGSGFVRCGAGCIDGEET